MSENEAYKKLHASHEKNYKKKLTQLDPNRTGLVITCPKCQDLSWLMLPECKTGWNDEIYLACPSACGYDGLIDTFRPIAKLRDDAGSFDIDTICKTYKTPYAFNGYIHRCPICFIENPREVMRDMVSKAEVAVIQNYSREQLKQLLSDIVSAFDGVMKRCYEIHMHNKNIFEFKTPSFQNVSGWKDKMADLIVVEDVVDDLNEFTRIFQKRHLFAHSLGVVDQKYIDKTGDTTVQVGKQVPLNSEEVLFLAKNTLNIVVHFFGYHLS